MAHPRGPNCFACYMLNGAPFSGNGAFHQHFKVQTPRHRIKNVRVFFVLFVPILFCSNSTVTVTLFSLGIVNMFPYWLKQSVASLANNRGLSNFKQVQESQPYTQGNKRICCCVTWPPCCRRCDGLRVLFWFGLNYLDGHQVKRETKSLYSTREKTKKKWQH